jgi:hypothetical protein
LAALDGPVYTKLFGFEPRSNISLSPDFWDEGDKVTQPENQILEKEFSEEEMKDAVFGSYAAGEPGPDVFSFLFFQKFWHVVKVDVIALARDFHRGTLDVKCLNFQRLLSYAARLVLLKACLASMPMYLMPVIKFPKWAINAINSQMTHFFWDNLGDRHKYHLTT